MAFRPCKDLTRLERSDVNPSGVTGFSSTILVFPFSSVATELVVDDVGKVPDEDPFRDACNEDDVESPFTFFGLPPGFPVAFGAAIFEIFSFSFDLGELDESLAFG